MRNKKMTAEEMEEMIKGLTTEEKSDVAHRMALDICNPDRGLKSRFKIAQIVIALLLRSNRELLDERAQRMAQSYEKKPRTIDLGLKRKVGGELKLPLKTEEQFKPRKKEKKERKVLTHTPFAQLAKKTQAAE
jgi:hypothetical protein